MINREHQIEKIFPKGCEVNGGTWVAIVHLPKSLSRSFIVRRSCFGNERDFGAWTLREAVSIADQHVAAMALAGEMA